RASGEREPRYLRCTGRFAASAPAVSGDRIERTCALHVVRRAPARLYVRRVGRSEVYVRRVPGPGGRIQISVAGGTEPLWSPRTDELFFRSTGKMMAAHITWQGDAIRVTREELFADVYPLSGS